MPEDKTQKPACAYTNFERLVVEYKMLDGSVSASTLGDRFEFDDMGQTRMVYGDRASIKALLRWRKRQEDVANNALRGAVAQPQAAEPKGEPAAWINYPCKIENNEFAGHGDPELTFKRQAYGYDLAKAEPLYRAAEPKGLTEEQRNALMLCYFETIAKYLEVDLPELALKTAEKALARLTKGE